MRKVLSILVLLIAAAFTGGCKSNPAEADGASLFVKNESNSALMDSEYAYTAITGDFDNDGKTDMAFTTGRIYWAKENGQLTKSNFALPAYCHSLAAGDIDGDGDIDLYFGCVVGHPDEIWFNNGDRTFTIFDSPVNKDTNVATWSVAIAQLDYGTGVDLVLSRIGYNPDETTFGVPTVLYTNDGHGNFTESQTMQKPTGEPIMGGYLLTGDIDGTGCTDIIISADRTWIVSNNCTTTQAYYNIQKSGRVEIADVDSDGDNDVFISESIGVDGGHPIGEINVYTNNGNNYPRFEHRQMISDAHPYFDMETADFDGDNDMDLSARTQFDGVDIFKNDSGTYNYYENLPAENGKSVIVIDGLCGTNMASGSNYWNNLGCRINLPLLIGKQKPAEPEPTDIPAPIPTATPVCPPFCP